jgi:hypothetical protein
MHRGISAPRLMAEPYLPINAVVASDVVPAFRKILGDFSLSIFANILALCVEPRALVEEGSHAYLPAAPLGLAAGVADWLQ